MKNFFASLLGTLAALAIALVGLCGLGLVLFIAASTVNEKNVMVHSGSYLVFDLRANLTDTPADSSRSGFTALLSGDDTPQTLQLRLVTRALREAARDKRIAGVLLTGSLEPSGYGTGFAALKEVRAALSDFKAAGKPVVAYLDFATARDLYLAAGATDLALDPYGTLVLPGLATEPMFYAGAFERFGVGVQVTKSGIYKSYAEPFVRKDLSPENREQLQKLLDDVWGDLVTDLAQDRNMPAAALQGLVDNEGLIRPEVAVQSGLVDRLAYRDEILAKLKKATGKAGATEPFTQISIGEYAGTLAKDTVESSHNAGTIAVLYAEGAIVDGEGQVGEVGGARFSRELRRLRQDDNVKAIVLRVNSPGGSATASEHIQREIRLAQAVKPVVISMGSYAASGGYWISAYSRRIFAEPTTITGSIGVVGIHFDVQKLANDLGLTWDRVQTGRHAGLFTISRPKSPEELALFQRMVDWIYGEFIRKVAEGRHLDPAAVRKIAEGRVWSGAEAVKLGLVDELGGLDAAIAYAAKESGLGGHYALQEFPQAKSLAEKLSALFEREHPAADARAGVVSQVVSRFKEQAQVLDQFNDPSGVYARLPVDIIVR
ncbi:MAG: signal peptide peptidase SppA [Verrucomicrobia bacterium]|nr:signal peptide peptidase SppA [Verrucomicrobiota bacterium]